MRKLLLATILSALVAIGVSVPNAYAASWNPEYQAHLGACAKSTSSISTGVEDLAHNNVLDEFAAEFGIHGPDGPKYLMKHGLVEGKIAKAVVTVNYGCENDTGIVFEYDHRELHKGEHVMTVPPGSELKKIKGEVCKHISGHGCHPVEITVSTVLPISCWNKNHELEVTIHMFIGVREPKRHPKQRHPKHHPHKHHHGCGCTKTPKPTPTPTPTPTPIVIVPPSTEEHCSGNNVNNGSGSAGNCNHCVGVNVCNPVIPPEEHQPPPPTSPTCEQEPEAEKCKPLIVNLETINDMEVSLSPGEHTRTICFEVIPGAESTLSDYEVALHVAIGETLSKYAEYKGGSKYCQKYESAGEPGTEHYYAWARNTKTGAHGQSETLSFPTESGSIW